MDTEIDGEVLLHVNDEVRESLLAEMDPDEILAAAGSLETDDLVELLDDLPDALTDQVLHSMDVENRERLEHMLTYPEDTAGRLMNTDVVTVRADVSIDVVLRYLRLRGEVPRDTNFIYVISRRRQYLGRLAVSALLTADPETLVNRIMDDSQPPIPAETSESEVAHRFANYDWTSAPVVDDNNVLLGRITIDDVVDIIREEAEHQVYGAAGLDEEEDLFSPVPRAARRRAVWLGLNLLTAFLAAWVVGNFQGVIAHMVAVAVLMSVVPSMGGVAGTQTLTITVRALALGQIGLSNAVPLLWKEILVAVRQWPSVGHRGRWRRLVHLPRHTAVHRLRRRHGDQPAGRRSGRCIPAAAAQAHAHRPRPGRRRDPDHGHRRLRLRLIPRSCDLDAAALNRLTDAPPHPAHLPSASDESPAPPDSAFPGPGRPWSGGAGGTTAPADAGPAAARRGLQLQRGQARSVPTASQQHGKAQQHDGSTCRCTLLPRYSAEGITRRLATMVGDDDRQHTLFLLAEPGRSACSSM